MAIIEILEDTILIDNNTCIKKSMNEMMSKHSKGVRLINNGNVYDIPFSGTTVDGTPTTSTNQLASLLLTSF